MNERFVNVTANDMRAKLRADKGWKETNAPYTKEIVFEFPINKYPFLVVKVYSGIKVGDEQSRGCGKDAIRTVVINTNTDDCWINPKKRVYRTKSWRENLESVVRFAIQEAINRAWRHEQANKPKTPQANPYKSNTANYVQGMQKQLSHRELLAESEALEIESWQQ